MIPQANDWHYEANAYAGLLHQNGLCYNELIVCQCSANAGFYGQYVATQAFDWPLFLSISFKHVVKEI